MPRRDVLWLLSDEFEAPIRVADDRPVFSNLLWFLSAASQPMEHSVGIAQRRRSVAG